MAFAQFLASNRCACTGSLKRMERMNVTVMSVIEKSGQYKARARAEADQAKIWIEIQFQRSCDQNVWAASRIEVLRFLDIA